MPAGMASLQTAPLGGPAALPSAVLAAASKINSNIAEKTGGVLPTSPAAALLSSSAASVDKKPAHQQNEDSLEEETSIKSNQRFEVMKKLEESRSGAAAEIQSNVLLLENMATPEDVDEELKEEISEECGKYGQVQKVVIWNVDSVVDVLVQFDSMACEFETWRSTLPCFRRTNLPFLFAAAIKCRTALENRWFAGRKIKATLFDRTKFEAGNYTK